MNPYDERQRARLGRVLEYCYRQTEPFRKMVSGLVEEYAGSGYGTGRGVPRYEILLNLLNQAVDAYVMSLAANRPRVLLSTKRENLKPFAKHFEVALNNLIQEIELEFTLRQAVLDAFFCLGIVKIHMANSVPVMLEEGVLMDPGMPFASPISLDNFVFDTNAKIWHKVQFAGDIYSIPYEELQSSDIFDQEVVKQIQPVTQEPTDSNRLNKLSMAEQTGLECLEPRAYLCDIWIARDQMIYTFAVSNPNTFQIHLPPLAAFEWDGEETGPYALLAFNDVPENIMPSSPASHLAGLARLANNLMRKQRQRAHRQKDVNVYTPSGTASAKAIQSASDGDWAAVDNVKEIGVHKSGGIDPGAQAFLHNTMQMFDRMAGNLGTMLGLGPAAQTVGQERIIAQAVSKKEAQLQQRTLDFAVRVIRSLGRLLWNDQAKVIPGQIQIPGTDIAVDSTWTPERRQGSFPEYDIQIDIFSMAYQSPAQRVKAIQELVGGVFLPLAPVLAEQGGIINLEKLTEIYAELLNLPQLKEVVQFGNATLEGAESIKPPGPHIYEHQHSSRMSQSEKEVKNWTDKMHETPVPGV